MGRGTKAAAKLRAVLASTPPLWPAFRGGLRSEAVTARVGRLLGIAFGLCFVTGIISHYQYTPWSWIPIPAAPVWGYRLSQGTHVITGLVSIPLLITKLWSVFPKLFQWPPVRSVVHG
ncbi:MAG: molybdopterin-binding protein, partial [Jatrophihabitantaceae bacterium]